MSPEELFAKWANKKWPKYEGKIIKVSPDLGVRYEGYCETCRYEVATVEFNLYGKGNKYLGQEEIDGDLASFLNEILKEVE